MGTAIAYLASSLWLAVWPHVPTRSVGQGDRRLQVEVHLLDQSYCRGDDELFVASLRFKAVFVNVLREKIILARQVENPLTQRVAAINERGGVGELEYEFSWTPVYLTEHGQSFAAKPDSERFVVLEPGDSYETAVQAGVMVRQEGAVTLSSDAIAIGTSHYLQLNVPTWPYVPMPTAQLEGLRERWAPYGYLATEPAMSEWVRIAIPEDASPEDCEED